ncbi:MAG: glycosyltransferase family 4 protein [Xanthobacteraceae bacterium]
MVKALAFAVPGELTIPTGGYGYARRIITELDALGWETQVINLGSEFPWPSAHTRRLAAATLRAVRNDVPLVVDGLAYGALPEVAQRLGQTHRVVVLVHHPLALETGLRADQSAALQASEQSALASARHIIVSSGTTKRLLVSNFNVPPERVSIVSPGTDMSPPHIRRQDKQVRLLAVGSVVPRKGYDVLIRALARLLDLSWELAIAGDCTRSPETTRQLQREMHRLKLEDRIVLRGALGTREIAALYDGSDIFVLPSRYEGYGMAYAEALAHGLPVIGTVAGAVPETVPAQAGILVPVNDVDALTCALRRMIEDPVERERFAAGARASRFPSWREQGKRFSEVLESRA